MLVAKGIAVPFNLFNSPRDTLVPRFPWQPSQLKRVSEVRRTVCKRDEKRKARGPRPERREVAAENLKLRTGNSVRLMSKIACLNKNQPDALRRSRFNRRVVLGGLHEPVTLLALSRHAKIILTIALQCRYNLSYLSLTTFIEDRQSFYYLSYRF